MRRLDNILNIPIGAGVALALALGFTASGAGAERPAVPSSDSNLGNHGSVLHASKASANSRYLPLDFEPNVGQTSPEVKFLAHGAGYTVYLTDREAVLALRDAAPVRIRPVCGGSPKSITGAEPTSGVSNYLVGPDPSKWLKGIPNYRKVNYEGVCPGVDLVFYGNPQQLEYDLILAARSDPAGLRLQYSGVESIGVTASGDLAMRVSGTQLTQLRPQAFQMNGDRRVKIDARYRILANNQVGFALAGYRRDEPVVIDPVLVYSSYLGGTGGDNGSAIAVDSNGNSYITGSTLSTNFPTAGPAQANNAGNYDVWVAKISPTGTKVYATYLGGESADYGAGIAVDASGNAYVVGQTNSSGFPTVPAGNPAQSFSGYLDAFITKLNANGNGLVYSTYIGGSLLEQGTAVAVDATGFAYVTGLTNSGNFPTTVGAFQRVKSGNQNVFVVKVNQAGSAMVYSTYLGGGQADLASAIAVDGAGNAYMTGSTTSPDFPTTVGAAQTLHAGNTDGFVTKLNASGSGLVYSTFLGGSGDDRGTSIAVDADGKAYVAGATSSTNFPTQTPFQALNGGGFDGFIVQLNASGSTRVYATYFGGNDADSINGIAVDGSGKIYVTGSTLSSNFPLQNPFDSTGGVFVSNLNSTGDTLIYSTRLAGNTFDAATGIAVDSSLAAHITGTTTSSTFRTASPFQPVNSGGANGSAFITSISPTNPVLSVTKTHSGNFTRGQTGATYNITVTNGSAVGTSPGTVVVTETIPTGLSFVSMSGAGWGCIGGVCSRSDALAAGASYPVITLTVNVATDAPSQVTNQVSVSGGGSASANASDPTTILAPAAAPPSVHIDSPAAGTVVTSNITVAGWALDNVTSVGTAISSVRVSVDGGPATTATYGINRADVCAAYPGRPGCPNVGFSYQLNIASLNQGPHTLTVTATDSDASPASSSVSVSITVSVPPSVHIDAPAPGASVSGVVTVAGWAIDNVTSVGSAIGTVQVSVDGTPVGNATYGLNRADVCAAYPGRPGCPNVGFSYQLNTAGLSSGPHTLTVSATNTAASPATGSSTVSITVSSIPPAVHIDTPAPGATVSGTVTIAGWAIDNTFAVGTAISSVKVFVDGTLSGNATYGISRPDVCAAYPGRPGCPNVGFTYSLNTAALTSGQHTVTVSATDSDGVPAVGSTTLTVSVSSPPPNVVIDTPSPSSAVSGVVSIAGWTLDNATAIGTAVTSVQVKVDGVSVGSATYGINRPDVCAAYPGRPGCPNVGFAFSLDTATLAPGPHTITVSATDSDATPAVGSASVSITVAAVPPSVHIDSPASGATVSGTVTVAGWAIDNTTSSGTAISTVQVLVDGTVVGTATYGSSRPDVCAAYPGRPGCPNVGFTFPLDTTTLSPGAHSLTVRATDSDGTPDTGSATISISK